MQLVGCGWWRGVDTDKAPDADKSSVLSSANTSPKGLNEAAADLPKSTDSLLVPGVLKQNSLISPLADAYRRINPQDDGWDSEAFGEAASAQLNVLASQLLAETPDLSEVVARDSTLSIFSKKQLERLGEVFRDRNIVVRRIEQAEVVDSLSLHDQIRDFQTKFSRSSHVKFKLFRVIPQTDAIETVAYFHADGTTEGTRRELSSTWTVSWLPSDSLNAAPLIQDVRVTDLELVETPSQTEPLFADCTASVFGEEPVYREQFLRGTDYWRTHIARDFGLDVVANHGLAIGDVNGDMLEDLYVCQQGGLPNRLFLQQPDGTLKDASANSGADWLNYSASALLIDIDNDGDKDLAVAHELHLLVMRNDGTGKFTLEQAAANSAQTFSLAAADFNLDGDLDIFCCGYNKQSSTVRSGAMGEPMPYHDAQNGGPNTLWRNKGDGTFENATAEVGLDENNNRFAFAASWEDYDNDGDPDLYVANDYGRNSLYRNDDGHFSDMAHELSIEDMSAGMSVTWGDMNRDGHMDFHVSNMFSAAGNRITYQRQFKDSADGETKRQFQRHARGNSLFQADGNGQFRDISVDAGITMGRWAWASKFCDINNDGWQDILVNNGFISTQDTGDL